MEKKYLITLSGFLFLWTIAFSSSSWAISNEAASGPMIHVEETSHTFPTAFEGKQLVHDFFVSNLGQKNLEIKKVTHS
jgi:hypothetical protein